MNRWLLFFLLFIGLYGLSVVYFLTQADPALPESYRGGPADPQTFLSPEELEQVRRYAQVQNWLYFLGRPYEWAVFLLLFAWGLSHRMRNAAEKLSSKKWVRTALFAAVLFLAVEILTFPLHFYQYQVQGDFGLSHQPWPSWLGDQLKGFLLQLLIVIPLLWLFYGMIRKSPHRWWLGFWGLSIPIFLFLMLIQPVVMDPLFNDFQPLQNKALKEKILGLADQAGVPVDQVYQVNMSEKTRALNAYVNGIGTTARIVLWDTTLQAMRTDEILFIMAHEIGHYVQRHMIWLFVGSVFGMLVFFWLLYHGLRKMVAAQGKSMRIRSIDDLAFLPILLLIISLWSFAVSPVSNGISRQFERAADRYAMEMTQDSEAAIRSFQRLAARSLSQPNPPKWVTFFRYSHPPLAERIHTIQNANKNDSQY